MHHLSIIGQVVEGRDWPSPRCPRGRLCAQPPWISITSRLSQCYRSLWVYHMSQNQGPQQIQKNQNCEWNLKKTLGGT